MPKRAAKSIAKVEPKIIAGVHFDPKYQDITCLLWLFLYGRLLAQEPFFRPEGHAGLILHPDDKNHPYTGSGRFEHAQLFAQLVWPKGFEWSDWAVRDVQSFCEYDQTAITGGASTGKSAAAALYALLYYACCPFETGVYIVSTTVEQCKKRVWKMIFTLYPRIRQLFKCSVMRMSPTPSIMSILPDGRKDEAHGIFVVPLAKGEAVAIETLKGFHPRRSLLIGDETDALSLEVPKVQDNMRAGTNEFQVIWTGNDPSLFNALGQQMAPSENSPITIAHTEWDSHLGVHCIRKDGFDSPNIRDKDKWSGLMRQRDIDEIVRRNGGENTPGVYVMIRGLHPPEGVEDTVLSESLFTRYTCAAWVTWMGSYVSSVLLDPAFGGDRCVIRRMDRGICTDGKMRLLFHKPEIIPITVGDPTNPPEYQIAHAAKTFAAKLDVPPEEFIMDSTGTGRGVGAVLQREWSPRINLCEFGGACSELPVSTEDQKPANEVYDRRVTELVYSFRQFVEADMIRGLDAETAREGCARHFEIKGTGKGKRIAVETKGDMKDRGLASPDNFDNAILGVELCRRKGVSSQIMTPAKQTAHDSLKSAAKSWDFDGREDVYAEAF